MKMTIKKMLLLMTVSSRLVMAQDPHFSQYRHLPLYLNPAHTGNGIDHVRMVAVYRNQWASVTTPFTTQGFMVDKSVSRFGFGLGIVKNGAGKAGMNQIFLNGMLAYHLPVGTYSRISGALQAGMFQKSFNPNHLTFDSQYEEDSGFNPDLPSGEMFFHTKIIRPDLGLGLMFQRGMGNHQVKFRPYGGLSLSHINRPEETFFNSHNRLPVRQTYHAGAIFQLKEKITLEPLLVVMRQHQHSEWYAATVLSFLLPNLNKLQGGLMVRHQDAVMAYAGYQIGYLFIGTSYDLNISPLRKASRMKGGFELTLSYIPKRKISKAVPLPETKAKKVIRTPKMTRVPMKSGMPVIAHTPTENQPAIERPMAYPFGRPAEKPIARLPSNNLSAADDTVLQAIAPVIMVTDTMQTVRDDKRPMADPSTDAKSIAGTDDRQEITEAERPVKPSAEVSDKRKPAAARERKTTAIITNDADGDGITDEQDECPYIRGSILTAGCPDTDNDGVIDHRDDCPMEAGPAERNGCPSTMDRHQKSQLIKQFRNIEFETGKAIIRTPDIYDIIEYAIDVMYQYPNSTIVLTGHTDSEGDEFYNMKLSEARVNAVKRYLIGQGISERRIRAVYYGETMPLTDNSTEYGRARNRRVEINIIR
jgi:type IX secretion system PorP/SprF family membrane protein